MKPGAINSTSLSFGGWRVTRGKARRLISANHEPRCCNNGGGGSCINQTGVASNVFVFLALCFAPFCRGKPR